jgi:hypothetical protein
MDPSSTPNAAAANTSELFQSVHIPSKEEQQSSLTDEKKGVPHGATY